MTAGQGDSVGGSSRTLSKAIVQWGAKRDNDDEQQSMIHLLKERATKQQIKEMSQALRDYIKLAVDIRRGIAAGGGTVHADCEAVLLKDGSQQEDVWGADWVPTGQRVTFDALINIRPRQNNRSMQIQDQAICRRIEEIVRPLLEGV